MPVNQQFINRGTPNGGNGDTAREGAKKINENFNFLFDEEGEKIVFLLQDNTLTAIKNKINSASAFEIKYPGSVLIIGIKTPNSQGESYSKKTYRLTGKKRGLFGSNQTYVGFENLSLINSEIPNSDNIQNTPGTRTVDYGYLTIPIRDHVNGLAVGLTLEDSNIKLTVLKAEVNGTPTSFIYKGIGGTYGDGFDTLQESEIELLNEKLNDFEIPDSSIEEIKFTQAVKDKLNLFTQALKTAYNTASNWVQNNGQNVLNHLQSSSNPHSVNASQVGVESGAQKNVQSDFSVFDNTKDSFIKNKPNFKIKRPNHQITTSTYQFQAIDDDRFLIFTQQCTCVIPNGLSNNLEFQGIGDVIINAESGGTLNYSGAFINETFDSNSFFGIRTMGSDISQLTGTLKLS